MQEQYRDEGMKYLSPHLPQSNLTKLSISDNVISGEGLWFLSRHISQTQLSVLNMRNNNVSSWYYMEDFILSLSCAQLTHLYVDYNNNLNFENTNVVKLNNVNTPLWYKCNGHLQNIAYLFNGGGIDIDLLPTMHCHKYAMLAVAKEKGDEYLLTLKYLYLTMMRPSLFDKSKHSHHITEILSGNIEEKARAFLLMKEILLIICLHISGGEL